MTKYLLIWIGATLEVSALGTALVGYLAEGAAATVLLTFAGVLLLNGVSLQLFSSELREGRAVPESPAGA